MDNYLHNITNITNVKSGGNLYVKKDTDVELSQNISEVLEINPVLPEATEVKDENDNLALFRDVPYETTKKISIRRYELKK